MQCQLNIPLLSWWLLEKLSSINTTEISRKDKRICETRYAERQTRNITKAAAWNDAVEVSGEDQVKND